MGNRIEMTAEQAQCDNKMTILSKNRYFVLLMSSKTTLSSEFQEREATAPDEHTNLFCAACK